MRISILISFLLVSMIPVAAQDPGFSQLFANQLYLNPAYTGHPNYHRLGLVYRNQWLTWNSPFVTYGVSYDRFLHDYKSGVGINIINDVQGQGAINRLSADLLFSHTLELAFNIQLKAGLQAGGILRSQNDRNMVFPDMIDRNGAIQTGAGFIGTTSIVPDFAVGVVGEWDDLYGGVAVHHLVEPTESIGPDGTKVVIPRKYSVHVGYDIYPYQRYIRRNRVALSPNILYMQQQNFRQLSIGVYLSRNELTAGLWLRENLTFSSHTFVFMAAYYGDDYRFGYSYDFSIIKGGFRGINTSTHEVTFGKNFEYKRKGRIRFRSIRCPKI